MRIILLTFYLALIYINANCQIFHENFEIPDSVISTSIGSGSWAPNNRISTSGTYCDSVSTLAAGDVAYMTTLPFSTVGYNSLFLYFNQICKTEFFDNAIIEYSLDGGSLWSQLHDETGAPWGLNNCYYLGTGFFRLQGSRFQEASYATWQAGVVATPDSSWWEREVFDLTTLVNNFDVRLRFTILDANNNGGAGRAGWFIDDILVTDSLDLNLSINNNRLTGKAYVDLNSNLIHDIGEQPVIGQMIEATPNYWIYNTNSLGDFYLDVPFSGFVTIQPMTYSNTYYTVAPSTHTANFTGFQQTDSLNDFAFQPNGVFDDVAIDIINSTPFYRPGSMGSYAIIYKNKGTTSQNPTITLYPDSELTYIGSSIMPSILNSDSIVWNLTNVPPLFQGAINISFNINPIASFGTIIHTDCNIDPVTGDFNPSNNIDSASNMLINSWDPNAIEVTPEAIQTSDLLSPPDLDYTIYFQNTGNDTAFYIRVNNAIPAELNMNTYELISTSHNVALQYNPTTRLMQYIFNNILLPDSTTNQDESHGYIHYKIKPLSTLVAGDSIKSTADIYFDYNLAVTTNTAVTEIVDPTSINDGIIESNHLKVYPNPVIDEISVLFNSNSSNSVTIDIFNIFGQKVKTIKMGILVKGIQKQNVNVSDLSDGVYFIRLENENPAMKTKFVKM